MAGVVAGFAGLLLGLWGLPVTAVKFWVHWGRTRAYAWLLLYLVLGSLGGLLGWIVAVKLNWAPAGNELLDGIIYACGGHAVIRANNAQFSASDADKAGSLLGLGTRYVESNLESISKDQIEKKIRLLSPTDVARRARVVLAEILGVHSLPEAEAGAISPADCRMAKLLEERIKDLAIEPDLAKKEQLVEQLQNACVDEMHARRMRM